MANVPLTPASQSADQHGKGLSRVARFLVWTCAIAVLLAVFAGYEQVDLAIAWVTAKLC